MENPRRSTMKSASATSLARSSNPQTPKPIDNKSNIAMGASKPTTPISDRSKAELNIFTLFPKLPTEIRLHIWRYAMPGLRKLVCCKQSRSYSPRIETSGTLEALLQKCSEVRQEYENHFNFITSWTMNACVFIAPKVDVVDISDYDDIRPALRKLRLIHADETLTKLDVGANTIKGLPFGSFQAMPSDIILYKAITLARHLEGFTKLERCIIVHESLDRRFMERFNAEIWLEHYEANINQSRTLWDCCGGEGKPSGIGELPVHVKTGVRGGV